MFILLYNVLYVQFVFNIKDKLQSLQRMHSEDASPLLYIYSDQKNGLQLRQVFKNKSFACNKTTL
jgi:hypothetical protein